MNFSIDGGGLGNWSSIVKNILVKQNFELDGIIFAILGDDLDRRFMWKNDYALEDGTFALAAGINETWDPSLNPDYADTLKPYYLNNYLVLKAEEVEQIFKGEWQYNRSIKPYLLLKIWDYLKMSMYSLNLVGISPLMAENTNWFSMGQNLLIEDLALDCKKMNIPIISLSFLTEHAKSKSFAKKINSDFVDDTAFQNWLSENTSVQIQIKGDGHWNQKGAEAFANSMLHDIEAAMKRSKMIR